jgi:preprotein translocase subunit YajC
VEALAQILPLVLIVVVFWLLIVRPARRKQQNVAKVRSSVAVGDSILLGSGLYGEVRSIGDDGLRLEIAPGVLVRVHRDAVVSIEKRQTDESSADSSADETSAPTEPEN